MGNRNLVRYTDAEPNEDGVLEGWHNVLRIERSAAGQPGLFFIIEDWNGGLKAGESVVVVKDGNTLLRPVLEWLGQQAADPVMIWDRDRLDRLFPGMRASLDEITALTPVPKVIDHMGPS